AIESGRSFIIPLTPETLFQPGGKTFRAVKIKCVTYRGGPPVMEKYIAGAEELVVLQPVAQLAFSDFLGIHFEPVPVQFKGGGYISEALNGRTVMARAYREGIHTGYPLGVGQLLGMSFKGQPVGFIAMAIEDPDDQRIGRQIFSGLERLDESADPTEKAR